MRARDADALAAFGGIVGLNRPIDADTARAIVVDVHRSGRSRPAVGRGALPILPTKANMRVVTADFGSLARRRADRAPARAAIDSRRAARAAARRGRSKREAPWPRDGLRVVTQRASRRAEEWQALRFAWRVMAHVKSNTVIFTDRGPDARDRRRSDEPRRRGQGGVDEGRRMGRRRGRSLKGTVAASDAFFPFRDGLDAVAAAGATAVVQPGGSVRDAEVIAAADEHGLAMVFTGRRHFRH